MVKKGGFRIKELFAIPRNRRAAIASGIHCYITFTCFNSFGTGILMFMQQFCGVNSEDLHRDLYYTLISFSHCILFLDYI